MRMEPIPTHAPTRRIGCAQHWPTEGGEHLLVRRGESRCILVSSGVSPSEKMYARFRPCDAKLASGILTVAAAAAPPPPPGSTVTHWYDPRQAVSYTHLRAHDTTLQIV